MRRNFLKFSHKACYARLVLRHNCRLYSSSLLLEWVELAVVGNECKSCRAPDYYLSTVAEYVLESLSYYYRGRL